MKFMKKDTLNKILSELKPYRILVGLSLLMALICVADSILVPIHIGDAVDLIIAPGQVDFQELKVVLIEIIISISISGIAHLVMNVINNKIVYSMTADLRTRAFKHIETLPISYLDAHPYGDLVSRMLNDVDRLTDGLLMGFSELFIGVLTILGMLVFMFIVDWRLALVVILLTPLSLFLAKLISDRTHKHFENQATSRGETLAYANEIISNEKVVRAYGQEKKVFKKFEHYNRELEGHSLKAVFYSSLVNPATRFINALVYALTGGLGALLIIKGNGLTVGALTCFLTYAGQFAKPFNEISGVITELKNAFVSADRVYELLEEKGETEPEVPILRKKTEGHVEFKNVSFSYDPEKPLITGLDLDVKPGEHVAVVGRTGCGKTTLINLLMRFYDVSEGDILIDGESIYEMKREEVRSRFGMVLQDTFIKNGTVMDNIRVGAPLATEEEVVKAAKAAHADDFIRQLSAGYETVLSENGDGLSEGQKQLLCIARVMLALPPILILDEATSSIDTRTEYLVQKDFETMMEGRTSFIVAHRLSTVENADRILVMADGKIIEQGTHEELLQAGGTYAELYESQFKGIAV